MTIRFNPDLYANILAGLNNNNRDQLQVNQELSTGRRVNAPSDDPSATAAAINIHARQAQDDQFTQNISTLQGQLQTADSAMSSVVTALNQAISLGTQAGDASLSAGNRATLASQIQSVFQQVLSLSNTTYQGTYVFAGTNTGNPAFAANSGNSNGVSYNGNTGTVQVEISSGQKLTVNVPGSQIFTKAGSDVFAALTNLAQAAQSGTGVDTAVNQVRAAFDQVTAQRSFYGTALNRMENTQNVLSADKVQLGSQENTAIGVDTATAATQLAQVTTARNALLAAGARIQNTSLLDFLK